MMPHTSTAASRRAAIVSIGIKWALVLLVILNLLQLNLLYFSSSGSTRCILKAALAMRARARSGEAAPPPAAPVLPGSPLGSSEQLGKPVATRLQQTRSGRYALFVIYAWNYEVLLTAVRSYVAAGFGKSLIILDNTSNSTLLGDPLMAELAAEVIPTRTRLTFSQAQNFMADVAIERGYEYYFWGHSDVAVLARDESASFADDVIACVESSFRSRPNWGIIYFNYDWFSAIRTDLVRQVKYDTFVTVYMSDCDFYPRVRAAGFETLNYPQMCPSTKVAVYDINQPLDIPWKDHGRAKAILDEHKDAGGNRFQWKMDAMHPGEKAGWDLWERSSYLYLLGVMRRALHVGNAHLPLTVPFSVCKLEGSAAKWGPRQEGQPPCKIEIKEPITGNMTLPQRPFGNLAYLQRFWVQEDPDYDFVPILAGLGREQEAWANAKAAAPAAGLLAEDDLSFLEPSDEVEILSESGTSVEQLQAAQLGAAASQLRSASKALTQPGGRRPRKAAGAAQQDSGMDAIDENLASDDPLRDEKLAAQPDQTLSGLDADHDSEDQLDAEPDQDRGSAEEPDEGTQASGDEPASAEEATVTFLEDDVAVSENAEDLYPEGAKAGLWSRLDQEDGAEEPDSQPSQQSLDNTDASPAKASQDSRAAAEAQPDTEQGSSMQGEADAEPEEGVGSDELAESEDVDSPGQDDSYSKEYYMRQQADDEDYDAEYADQQDDAEYADEAGDAEYADPADSDGLEEDYTDLPEGSGATEVGPDSSTEAEDGDGSEAADSDSRPARVEAGVQAEARDRDAESAEPGRPNEGAGEGRPQEDAAAAAEEGDAAADAEEDAAAVEEMFGSGKVDVGPMPEEGLDDEFSDPADLGLDDMDFGDEFEDELDLQDAESEEEVDGDEEDLIEADPLEEGSADQ